MFERNREEPQQLPTFDDMRRQAECLLADAQDVLRSDWRVTSEPTDEQASALHDAVRAIADAKAALQRAAR